MQPFVGESRIRPGSGRHFQAAISAMSINNVNFFRVRSPSLHISQNASTSDYVINIPLTRAFDIPGKGSTYTCSRDFFLKIPDAEFNFSSDRGCSVLGICIPREKLDKHRHDLTGKRNEPLRLKSRVIPFHRAAAERLTENVVSLLPYGGTTSSGGLSSIAVSEAESALVDSVAGMVDTWAEFRIVAQHRTRVLLLCKDYLASCLTTPVSRAELAVFAGTSIRSISRVFHEELGYGPMSYLKKLRMEAAFFYLLGATPEEESVTSIASRYGFNHLGRFAVEFNQRFGESPAQTLRR